MKGTVAVVGARARTVTVGKAKSGTVQGEVTWTDIGSVTGTGTKTVTRTGAGYNYFGESNKKIILIVIT